MTLNTNETVREIAIHNPATVRVFESFGIDYCCGGKRSLEEACARANVPVASVMESLAKAETDSAAGDETQWIDASFRQIVAHIVNRHHAYVRQEVPRLSAMLDKVVARHGDTHPEVSQIRDLFSTMGAELSGHMTREEQILFPFLESLERAAVAGSEMPPACFGSVAMPISRMLADHEDAGEITSRIRALSGNFEAPEGACPTFRGLYQGLEEFERDLHHHVHLENNILFPRALDMENALAGPACATR